MTDDERTEEANAGAMPLAEDQTYQPDVTLAAATVPTPGPERYAVVTDADGFATETAPTYYGVYLAEGADRPVALFLDGDDAQEWRRQKFGKRGVVLTSSMGLEPAMVKAALDAREALLMPAAVAPSDPDAETRGRLRVQMEQQAREERIREEIAQEMRDSGVNPPGETPRAPVTARRSR